MTEADDYRPWLLGLAYWVTLLPMIFHPRLSGNVWSRYLTIESLVERGTLVVEHSPMLPISGTPDIVQFRGRLYSDKPPVLSVLASGIYAPLASSGVRFTHSFGSFVFVNLVLVSTTAAACAALTVACLGQLLRRLSFGRLWSDILALAFGYGSLLLPYALTFNNHAVAAGLMTAAFLLVLKELDHARQTWRCSVAGGLAGLAAVIDLPAGGAVFLAMASWLAVSRPTAPWAFAVGGLPFLVLHCVLQSLVTGSPLPAEFFPESFLYPGSYWASEAGVFHETVPRWQFGLEMLFGPQGWLTVTPVLALGFIGMGVSILRSDSFRAAAWTIGGASAAVLFYSIWLTRRTDFAGLSYGTRHLLALSPLVYFFAATLLARSRRKSIRVLFILLFGIGATYTVMGAKDPWSRIEQREEWPLRAVKLFTLYPWSSYHR